MNAAFITRNKSLIMILFKFCKLRLTNDKFVFNITHMILIKLIIENHVKNL